jgi:glycosyltransferase involved in cell wall biosynthesis
MSMKLLHIIPTFYPATYWGGPIYSVYGLCNATAKISGVTLRVLTTDAAGPQRSDAVEVTDFPMLYPGGYEVFFCRRWWAHSVSPGMILRLWPMIRWADVVHLTAVYSPPTIPTLLICRLLGKPVAWSPRGALQRWEGSTKPLAKRAWEWICNVLISRKSCVMHVTSEQEAADSEARIPNSASVLIPNGVDIPEVLPARSWRPDGKLRLLFFGRLHPKKGIENLLYALKAMGDETVSLAICGIGDEAYSRSLRELVHQLGLGERRVSFQGHVDGEEKMKAFMQADVCVVPSFTENFGMVVAEALAHGVPVIASKGTPWAQVEARDCGLWVENSPESLAEAICCIRTKALPEMGARGRDWMKEEFGWDAIAARMFSIYKNLTRGQVSN